MAKINLNDIQSIYDLTQLNQDFADIESEFQNKVLYRDNPDGEPNQMENNLDMNSNAILNAKTDLTDSGSLLTLGDADGRYVNVSGDEMNGVLSMQGTIDMNGNKVTNLGAGTNSTDAVNYSQLQNATINTNASQVYTTDNVNMLMAGDFAEGAHVTTKGYYTPGDGGGNDYEIVGGGTGAADGGSFIDLDNGLQARALFANNINCKQWGAVGDGVDRTTEIDNFFAFIESNNGLDVISSIFGRASATPIYFPKGDHVYSGSGFSPAGSASRVYLFVGDGQASTSIQITSDAWLCNPVNPLPIYVAFFNLKTIGGRGAYFCSNTTAQVQHARKFIDCTFLNYTSACIGSLGGDDARWEVDSCIFSSADTGTPVGIYLPSGAAEVSIIGNTFRDNKYHIVLSGTRTRDYVIGPTNTFFAATGTLREADIWFIASPDDSSERVSVIGNRFSNENLDSTKPTILIANRAASSDEVFNHDTTKTTNSVLGMKLKDNVFQGTGTAANSPNAVGLIYSYSSKVQGMEFESTVTAYRPCVLEFDSTITDLEIDAGHCWTNFGQIRNETTPQAYTEFSKPIGGGIMKTIGGIDNTGDSFIGHSFATELPLIQRFQQSSSTRVWNTNASAAKEADILDSAGGATGATYSFSTTTGHIFPDINFSNFREKQVFWFEIEAKKSAVDPLDFVVFKINFNGKFYRVPISLSSNWKRIRIPLISTFAHSGFSTMVLYIEAGLGRTATKNRVDIGRHSLYLSNVPASEAISLI